MVDTKQLAKEIRATIQSAKKVDLEGIEEEINDSALSETMKQRLHEELQVRMNEMEQEKIDEAVASGDKDLAQDLIERKQEEINSQKDMNGLPTIKVEIPTHKAVSATEEEMFTFQKQGKLVGWDPKAKIAKILASVLILALFCAPAFGAMTDKGSLGDGSFVIDSSGNLVPSTTATYNIGGASARPATIYTGALNISGDATVGSTAGKIALRSAASVVTPGATPTLTVGLSNIYTLTTGDNQDATITFSGAGNSGDRITLVVKSSGTADEVITFHATLVSSTGTLTIGTAADKYYAIGFISDGSHWYEVSRTAVQT